MIQIPPDEKLNNYPCCITAVISALSFDRAIERVANNKSWFPKMDPNGYVTLADANRFIRNNLNVVKRIDYKRGERPKLKHLHLDGKAIVCVLGHYLYLDHEDYYSFFDNEEDDVVSVWMLK